MIIEKIVLFSLHLVLVLFKKYHAYFVFFHGGFSGQFHFTYLVKFLRGRYRIRYFFDCQILSYTASHLFIYLFTYLFNFTYSNDEGNGYDKIVICEYLSCIILFEMEDGKISNSFCP